MSLRTAFEDVARQPAPVVDPTSDDQPVRPTGPARPLAPRLPAVLQLLRIARAPTSFLDRCAARYGDDFTPRIDGFGTAVVASNPITVRAATTTDQPVLATGSGRAILRPVFGDTSRMFLDGQAHRRQRQLLFRCSATTPRSAALKRRGRRDLIGLPLDVTDDQGTPKSDIEIRDASVANLLAGHETTAIAMAWALEAILAHPHVLDRIRGEPDAPRTSEWLSVDHVARPATSARSLRSPCACLRSIRSLRVEQASQ